MIRFLTAAAFVLIALGLGACSNDASIASANLSTDADNFKINRRITFYNGITDSYMLVITGYCSQEPKEKKLEVTCKVGDGQYKKHFLGLSDNVTYISEQIEPAAVGVSQYNVVFKPSSILPTIEKR